MLMRGLAAEWRRDKIAVTMICPGWVKTDMGGPSAPLEITDSVSAMRAVIDALPLDQTGQFVNYDGSPIPW